MNEQIKDGGPAFPVQDAATWQGHGMTLRDYFAAKAMQGDWAAQDGDVIGMFLPSCADEDLVSSARLYYRMADAMLAAREAKS